VPTWIEIADKPAFAPVAISGSYIDLANTYVSDGSETMVTSRAFVMVIREGTTQNPYIKNSAGIALLTEAFFTALHRSEIYVYSALM
jgi:hypothetical protein